MKAPFRFAPIGRWVYEPDWGARASHDWPFEDGLSGEVGLEIKATTPILIGGARRAPTKQKEGEEPTEQREGEVWPVQLPDGRWAIPGSTLQGLFRSILELATFARLGPFIDDRRFGVRDLVPASEPFYQLRINDAKPMHRGGKTFIDVTPRVRAGWLRRDDDDVFHLTHCECARVEFDTINDVTGAPNDDPPRRPAKPAALKAWKTAYKKARTLRKKSDVAERYSLLGSRIRHDLDIGDSQPGHPHKGGSLRIHYRKASIPGPSAKNVRSGKLVMTGAPSDAGSGKKHMEFFFFDEKKEERLEGFEPTFDEFLDIHEPDDGRPQNPNWKFYRDTGFPGERPFKKGGRMPILFIERADGAIDTFGLAFMFKMAHQRSTHEILANTAAEHREGTGLDFPCLLFGAAPRRDSETNGAHAGLKRRASFDAAVCADPKTAPQCSNPTVLLGPKPSYYPIYVRQPGKNGELPRVKGELVPYATYTPILENSPHPEHPRPELAGVKVWPTWADSRAGACALNLPDAPFNSQKSVQTRLWTLPACAAFSTTLRFHNLRPMELGALLWVLSFGDVAALEGKEGAFRHRLGMGKPYGLGSVRLRVTGAAVAANDADALRKSLGAEADLSLAGLCRLFAAHMNDVYRSKAGADHDWSECAQVKGLLEAARPTSSNGTVGGGSGYMSLKEYQNAKKDGIFLPVYPYRELPRRSNGGGIGAPPGPKGGGTPSAGRRIRVNVTTAEGVIESQVPNRPGEWIVKLDDGRSIRYKAHLFVVID